jgi:colanic acid/amylovoran biosynthesis glycosyltransferase
MRLLIAYPNPYSYSETFIHNHLRLLHPAKTLTNGWMPFEDENRKSIFRFALKNNYLRGLIKRFIPKWYELLYTNALHRFLVNNNITHVLSEYGITTHFVSEACKQAGVQLIGHFHGFDAYEHKTINAYKSRYKRMSEFTKRIVVVSEDMKQQALAWGIKADKIINNPYGVELGKFQSCKPQENEAIIISVGRFTGKKAPDLVIKAFQLVLKKHPRAKLQMVGNGELWEEAKALVQQLELESSITLLGVKSPDEISVLLSKAKIFVQHSLRPPNGDSEGTPNTVLEASATGLPIVSTEHAGIKEAVVHGVTGFLVPERDIEGMAEYICTLLDDKDMQERFGKAARQHMEQQYNLEGRIAALRNIIHD